MGVRECLVSFQKQNIKNNEQAVLFLNIKIEALYPKHFLLIHDQLASFASTDIYITFKNNSVAIFVSIDVKFQ